MARYYREPTTTWFLLGGGICVQTAWCFGTLLGHRMGAVITNPERYGLDFSFVAVFTALVFSFWKGRQDLLPWIIAAASASLSELLLPGKWYIVCGGVAGALAAALLPYKEGSDE
jgi:predicted branched-subunit amino acid permease